MNPIAIPAYPASHQLVAGKSVLITAAAGGGIGFSAARRFAEEGARAIGLSDIHERRLGEAVAKLKELTGLENVHGKICNVVDETQVQSLVDEAEDRLGGIDILINNAGLGGQTRVVDMTDDQWLKVIDVSLNSVFRMTRATLKKMMPRNAGIIINNASVLGWRAQKEQAHYAAAKAGVMAFTRCVGLEAAEHGIRVNCVSPSIVMHEFLKKAADEALLKDLVKNEAYGRGAEGWEIANVMVFLASEYASYMVGEVVSVSSQHP